MEIGESSQRGALSKFQELLKCSVCSDFMYTAIYECSKGHKVCSSCKKVVNECPFASCWEEFDHTRCLALEKMAELYQPQCKYTEFGCREIIPYPAKLVHEDTCEFKPYHCPLSEWGCYVIGNITFLISHLTNYHETKIINLSEFNFRILITNCMEDQKGPWMISNCFGEYFYLQGIPDSIRSPPTYMAFLRFMGTPTEASKYSYKLEIERDDGMKFNFEGTPISLRQSFVNNDDALVWTQDITRGRKIIQEIEVKGLIWKKGAL